MDTSPKPILPTREPDRMETCNEHGSFTSRNIVRSIWTNCPSCEAARQFADAEAARTKAAADADTRHRRMLDAARIPARFERCTFDSFVAKMDCQRQALSVVRDFAETFPEQARRGATLILSGLPGTGKSHLAGALLRALMSDEVRYITCLEMIQSVRDTWRRDSERSETQLLRYFERLDLLVIDEVGMQYGTPGEKTILFDVLDRRYREMRATVLITNLAKDGFKEAIGDRAYDRMCETSRWVSFSWPSYRPIARKELA